MKIYDSLTQTTKNLPENKITIYNCGPTVYNYVHIGNIRPLITFDVLYNYLKLSKKSVQYAHNLTDVDDKIIKRAKEEKTTELAVSEKYGQAYLELIKELNANLMDFIPKVTENIEGIIGYVQQLVQADAGYEAQNGDVYFSIDKVKNIYGQLSKQNVDNLIQDARKEIDVSEKKNPLDFVLWKKTTEGVNWQSPWNEHGRPGWHTECAYFISKYFGEQVTIHGGGIDLKFPHHENERAQHYALYHKEMAQVWMHVGHVNVNNVKMSKSLGNFILAKDILAKYSPNVVRWFFLQTKYENPINYSETIMDETKKNFNKLVKDVNLAIVNLALQNQEFIYQADMLIPAELVTILDEDLDFPNSVAYIIQLIKTLSGLNKERNYGEVEKTINKIIVALKVFNITYNYEFIKQYAEDIKLWKEHLANKDYQKVDEVRAKLIKEEII